MIRSKVSMAWTSLGAIGAARRPFPVRRAAAWALSSASAVLDRWATRIAVPAEVAGSTGPAALEFYAQSGAPEGALYVDGRFVGWIEGVQRL